MNIGIGYVLSHAMVSGDLAAQAILTSTSDDLSGLARRYGRSCDYEIGVELRDSVRIQHYLFADRRRIARVIGGAHREQALIRLILEFVVGRRSYRDLRRRMLVRSPSLACRIAWERLTKKPLSGAARLSSI
jgi:flavin-dependent dehydrogenase